LWNAWIFMLLEVLTFPLFIRIATGRAPEVEGKSQVAAMSRTERIALYSSKAIYIPAFIYSIFLPLKLGTVWFYVGLPITLMVSFCFRVWHFNIPSSSLYAFVVKAVCLSYLSKRHSQKA